MKNDNIENIFTSVKLRAPRPGVRNRVLATASSKWKKHTPATVVWQTLRWTWCYAAAVAVLLVCNTIYSTFDAHLMQVAIGKPVAESALIEQTSEWGEFDYVFQPQIHNLRIIASLSDTGGDWVSQWRIRQKLMSEFLEARNSISG